MFEKEEGAEKLGSHMGKILTEYYESLDNADYAYGAHRAFGGIEVSPKAPSAGGDLSLWNPTRGSNTRKPRPIEFPRVSSF